MFISLMKTVSWLLLLLCAPLHAGAILMYHHVSDSAPAATSVTLEQFRMHLDRLDSEGFQVVRLDQLLARLRAGDDTDNMVAITFDDGYASIARHALPALERHGWQAAVFVTLDQVGAGTSMMSLEDLQQAHARGHLVLNHGMNHAHMVRRPVAEVVQHIEQAQAQLARLFDSPPWLAWPYGEYSPALRQALGERGYIAFGQHTGVAHPAMDWQAIPRIAVNRNHADWPALVTKLRALPLPVTVLAPDSGITRERRPELRFSLDEPLAQRLSCFVAGRPVSPVINADSISLRASEPLAPGRHRYTCTAPAGGQRFYWFTWQWMVRAGDQWYEEP